MGSRPSARRSVIWQMPSEEFCELVASSSSTTEVLVHFGLKNKGGNNKTLKRRMREEEVDDSHLAPSHAKMVELRIRNKKSLSEVMVENSSYNRGHLKRRIIEEGLLVEECAFCGQGTVWRGGRLSLVLDHINGIGDDHRQGNLRLLCPNCNSQTETFCRSLRIKRFCSCGKEVSKHGKSCGSCASILNGRARRHVERPSLAVLYKQTKEKGFCATGRLYGVSDNAIRKWIKSAEKEKLE